MIRLLRSDNFRLVSTILSVSTLIILVALFYLPNLRYAIIPYVYMGWFLPIEGIILLLAIGGISIITSVYQFTLKRDQNRTLADSLADYWWVGMRVYLGFSWITATLFIWTPEFIRNEFPGMIDYMASEGPLPWYNALLTNLVSPNAHAFANSIKYAQLFIGFCLLLGLLTNLASVIGFLLNVNFFIAISWADPTWTVAAQNVFVAFHEFFFILLFVGRRFGIDELIAKEFPRGLLW